MVTINSSSDIVIEEVTDPQEIARHQAQHERHSRNLKWLESHWHDLPNIRGRYVAVANEKSFVAETAAEGWNWARSQEPADDGAIVMLVPASRGWRIYANRPSAELKHQGSTSSATANMRLARFSTE